MSSPARHCLIFGGSGQVGRHLVRACLQLSGYTSVVEVGRRAAPDTPSSEKRSLVGIASLDGIADAATEIRQQKADTVLITLGTSGRAAGSAEAFKAIDQEAVVEFAKVARSDGQQRLIYCSSWGSSLTSSFLYPKSKAETEKRLAELDYTETIIFKPAFLAATQREEFRPGDKVAPFIMGLVGLFGVSSTIEVAVLGRAIANAGLLGVEGLKSRAIGREQQIGDRAKAWYIDNAAALSLAKLQM